MKHFRELQVLEPQLKGQIAIIRPALNNLVKIGYLDYNEYKKVEKYCFLSIVSLQNCK